MNTVVVHILKLRATPEVIAKMLRMFEQGSYGFQDDMDFEVIAHQETLEVRVTNKHFRQMFASIGQIASSLWVKDPEKEKWPFECHFDSVVEFTWTHAIGKLWRNFRKRLRKTFKSNLKK